MAAEQRDPQRVQHPDPYAAIYRCDECGHRFRLPGGAAYYVKQEVCQAGTIWERVVCLLLAVCPRCRRGVGVG